MIVQHPNLTCAGVLLFGLAYSLTLGCSDVSCDGMDRCPNLTMPNPGRPPDWEGWLDWPHGTPTDLLVTGCWDATCAQAIVRPEAGSCDENTNPTMMTCGARQLTGDAGIRWVFSLSLEPTRASLYTGKAITQSGGVVVFERKKQATHREWVVGGNGCEQVCRQTIYTDL